MTVNEGDENLDFSVYSTAGWLVGWSTNQPTNWSDDDGEVQFKSNPFYSGDAYSMGSKFSLNRSPSASTT